MEKKVGEKRRRLHHPSAIERNHLTQISTGLSKIQDSTRHETFSKRQCLMTVPKRYQLLEYLPQFLLSFYLKSLSNRKPLLF